MSVTITYDPDWRASYWDDDVPGRPAWFVECPDHPKLGKGSGGEPWGYAKRHYAETTRTRHINAYHARRLSAVAP